MMELVNALLERSLKVILGSGSDEIMKEMNSMENKVDEKERELQQNHIDRLTRGECTPEAGMIFSDVAAALERVADHAVNIASYITKRDAIV